LEKGELGQTSIEPAKRLWEVFILAANATNASPSSEVPWQLMHDFARRLSNMPEAAAAVTHLIGGLIVYGTRAAAPPKLLRALHDDLNFMKSFMGTENAPESLEAAHPPAKEAFFFQLFRKFRMRRPALRMEPSSKRRRLIDLTGLAIIVLAALGSGMLYVGQFDKVRSFWPKTSLLGPAQQAIAPRGVETKPQVGTGQHLALDGVRYCHFQQERLRMVKQDVRGPEDARAYNLLIVDYNSRCSDFFYRDDDLKLVRAEVSAKKDLLAADAKSITSTWPGRVAEGAPNK
jgi:hypothetical protein